jgi:hypothetical protein
MTENREFGSRKKLVALLEIGKILTIMRLSQNITIWPHAGILAGKIVIS